LDQVDAGVHAVNRLFDSNVPDVPVVVQFSVGGSKWR